MKPINPEALEYIQNENLGVLAVEMLDGSPHGATLHFAHTSEPFQILIRTGVNTIKAEALIKHGKTRASFVVGVDEVSMKTLQFDGIVHVVSDDEEVQFLSVFGNKFPHKKVKPHDPHALNIIFTPTWWRFSDSKNPEGKKVWVSM